MKPVAFDYYRPNSVDEALVILAKLREDAAVLSGGMTLGPMLNMRLARPRAVIDISRLQALKSISSNRGTVVTGAGVVQADALQSDVINRELPLLTLALPWVGHFQTRNRGTLGGSVAHADPSAEIPLCLVVCDGTVVLQSRRGERRVPAREFFLGAMATARRADEMIIALEWPRMPTESGYAFEEIAQRHGDFALAAAACWVKITADGQLAQLSLGLGGVESRPVAVNTHQFVNRPAEDLVDAVAEHAASQVDAMEDHTASAEYRRALTRILVARVFETACARASRRGGAL